MKPSEKMTDKMMLKAYSYGNRKNYEIAIVILNEQWFRYARRIFAIARSAGVGLDLKDGYRDGSAKFLIYIDGDRPFYECFFGDRDIVFLEADSEEIELLYTSNEYMESQTLLFTYEGIAHYRTSQDIGYQTAEFDLEVILEILNHNLQK
ncbi:hypothetical protein BBI01_01370 [Chryseobacterium artocarpi]|uniref:Uncharacterized protein n=1 Tax=Chryseobacterium artocarpi TaxID=1414727 RepID=A0A1B8ZZW2_9FLAO|nr:hypothetical protein [Chryseobacterium artocarpi]OCA77141.1 hypothetical protein BBI01_01370 [Chryseobacterium artocarpi]